LWHFVRCSFVPYKLRFSKAPRLVFTKIFRFLEMPAGLLWNEFIDPP